MSLPTEINGTYKMPNKTQQKLYFATILDDSKLAKYPRQPRKGAQCSKYRNCPLKSKSCFHATFFEEYIDNSKKNKKIMHYVVTILDCNSPCTACCGCTVPAELADPHTHTHTHTHIPDQKLPASLPNSLQPSSHNTVSQPPFSQNSYPIG